jgi:hypothetical protein
MDCVDSPRSLMDTLDKGKSSVEFVRQPQAHYGIHPHDALTFAAVPAFLAVIALVACWIPARRAASVEPMMTLRTE